MSSKEGKACQHCKKSTKVDQPITTHIYYLDNFGEVICQLTEIEKKSLQFIFRQEMHFL